MPASPYYQDDKVTLYHGDCREITEWLTADVLVTDPPYGIAWQSRQGAVVPGLSQRRTYRVIQGDADTAARDEALNLWGRKPAIVFGSWRFQRPENTAHRLIWHKRGQGPGPLKAAFMSQDEEVYVLGEGWRKSSPPLRSVIATDEERSVQPARYGHPTPKPLDLMEILVDRCPPGVIADPFAGSGSTLVAARNLGRRAIGVEVKERYCEVIAKRLAQDCLDLATLT